MKAIQAPECVAGLCLGIHDALRTECAVGLRLVQAAGAEVPVFCFSRSSTLAAVGRVRLPKPAASSRSATLVGFGSVSSASKAFAAAASSDCRSRRRRKRRLGVRERGRAARPGEAGAGLEPAHRFGRRGDAPAAFELGQPLDRPAHRCLQAARSRARRSRAPRGSSRGPPP